LTYHSDPKGAWTQTSTGKKFYFVNTPLESIDVIDIAHSLSNICRWMGHCSEFYSVAQHSVLLSLIAPAPMKMFALFHDAHEAYLGDLARPLKRLTSLGEEYTRLADPLQRTIEKRFNITPPENMDEFHLLDSRMCVTEAAHFMENDFSNEAGWMMQGAPFEISIYPWTPTNAKNAFLKRYADLHAQQAVLPLADSEVPWT
jgi:hypothetical protein